MTIATETARARAVLASMSATEERRLTIVAYVRRPELTAGDVEVLRRLVAEAGVLSRAEAEALFDLDAADGLKPAGWMGFFIETITDHVVWDARPTGIVNEGQAEWVLNQCDRAGTLSAFGVLVNVLAEAHRVPLWFLAAVRARAARGLPDAEAAIEAAEALEADLAPGRHLVA